MKSEFEKARVSGCEYNAIAEQEIRKFLCPACYHPFSLTRAQFNDLPRAIGGVLIRKTEVKVRCPNCGSRVRLLVMREISKEALVSAALTIPDILAAGLLHYYLWDSSTARIFLIAGLILSCICKVAFDVFTSQYRVMTYKSTCAFISILASALVLFVLNSA